MAPTTDPSLSTRRSELAALGERLVDLESDPTVTVARGGVLTGGSAITWTQADTGIAYAWEIYRAVDELLGRAEADRDHAAGLLAAPSIPTPAGNQDAATALATANQSVEEARGVAANLAAAWGGLASRIQVATDAATAAGDNAAIRAAAAVTELLAGDPLAVTEADVAHVESLAQAASGRRAAAQAATGRLDVDLVRARATLDSLDADAQGAATELAHATSRIADLVVPTPARDLAALGEWLDRIAAMPDRPSAAATLNDWFAAADARRAELDRALATARDGMQRRAEGRGLWSALRAKAGARKLDERPEVAAALDTAREELWRAPCDLDAAELALSRLAAALEARPGGPR
ncbi:MAG TPA: hypothetical protein VFB94_03270 [Acidimicrobiales bacterium]|nr:hypothetical protein [Acidimicrobiales bacterium]